MTVKLTREAESEQQEAGLAELLAWVQGKRYPFSPGISVHRERPDGGALMAAMCELERRSLVKRHYEDEARIDWAPLTRS
jgi:hypothetical protein